MITANLIRQINFPGVDNICLYRFDIPSVAASTISDDIQFTLNGPAKLENFRVHSDSPNYNFSLLLEPAVVTPSIEEIYSVVNINKAFFDDFIELWWAKPAGPDSNNLYGVIKNNGVATGTITFEFVFKCF